MLYLKPRVSPRRHTRWFLFMIAFLATLPLLTLAYPFMFSKATLVMVGSFWGLHTLWSLLAVFFASRYIGCWGLVPTIVVPLFGILMSQTGHVQFCPTSGSGVEHPWAAEDWCFDDSIFIFALVANTVYLLLFYIISVSYHAGLFWVSSQVGRRENHKSRWLFYGTGVLALALFQLPFFIVYFSAMVFFSGSSLQALAIIMLPVLLGLLFFFEVELGRQFCSSVWKFLLTGGMLLVGTVPLMLSIVVVQRFAGVIHHSFDTEIMLYVSPVFVSFAIIGLGFGALSSSAFRYIDRFVVGGTKVDQMLDISHKQ